VQSSQKGSVRAELVRLQKETGLSLAYFYRSIEIVSFADRLELPGKEILSVGQATGGDISPDGTEIAFLFWNSERKTYVAIMRPDGSARREYPQASADAICWSYDKSKLAMEVQDLKRGTTAPNDPLLILNLGSGGTQEIDVRAYVTSQCWSPNNKQLVYGTEETVRLYDIERNMWTVLAKGREPTWSPDGNWIAFLDDDSDYAIRPSGEDRRLLFKTKGAMSGLWWSPDSRIVAYVSRNRRSEPPLIAVDVGWVRLRVKRLADGSEDWVAQLSDAYVPRFHWLKSTNLASRKD
jgi:Tol biopolymer transport system component